MLCEPQDPPLSNRLAVLFDYSSLMSTLTLSHYYSVELPKLLTAEQKRATFL